MADRTENRAGEDFVIVSRAWLHKVDGFTSLVAYRGLDKDSETALKQISIEARRLASG